MICHFYNNITVAIWQRKNKCIRSFLTKLRTWLLMKGLLRTRLLGTGLLMTWLSKTGLWGTRDHDVQNNENVFTRLRTCLLLTRLWGRMGHQENNNNSIALENIFYAVFRIVGYGTKLWKENSIDRFSSEEM